MRRRVLRNRTKGVYMTNRTHANHHHLRANAVMSFGLLGFLIGSLAVAFLAML